MGAAARRVAAREAAGTAGQGRNAPGIPGETPAQTAARSAEQQRLSAWQNEYARSRGRVVNGMPQILGDTPPMPAGWQPGGGVAGGGAGGGAGVRAGALLGGADGGGNTAVNTAAPVPGLQGAIDRFNSRFDADQTKRATDRVFTGAKSAAAGLNNDLDAQMARRGIGGSGLDARGRSQIAEAAARAAAGGAANIQMAQQDRLDRLATAGPGIEMMPANLALAQQGLGLQQLSLQNQSQNSQAQLAMQQAQMEQQRQQQQMQNWLALMNAGLF